MNIKRFLGASLLVFLFSNLYGFVVHNIILLDTYKQLTNLWRPDLMAKMWIFNLIAFLFSFVFVYVFIKGYEGKGVLEGIRYGIIMGILLFIAVDLNQYILYALPFSLIVKWLGFGMIQNIICGIITAVIYKPNKVK